MTVESFTQAKECSNYKKIDGKEYCVKRSNITLNSCGRESDWPCMEEGGCLIIDKFTLKFCLTYIISPNMVPSTRIELVSRV